MIHSLDKEQTSLIGLLKFFKKRHKYHECWWIKCSKLPYVKKKQKKKKTRSTWYPAETTTDRDYADDLALLRNTLTPAKSLLHSLEQATRYIGLRVNENKTEYMRYK